MTHVCRICMSQDSAMTDIFEPAYQETVLMIEYCTGVLLQKTEGVSSHICSKCLIDLHTAYNFKTKCLEAEKAIQQLIDTKLDNKQLKIENGDLDDDNRCDLEIQDMIHLELNEDRTRSIGDLGENEISDIKEKKSVARRRKASNENEVKPRRGINKFRRLFCELCQLKFDNRQESESHKKKFHKERKSWICEVCGRAYAHRSSQIAHRRSHYEPSYACDSCDYSTYNKFDLVKHVRIHTGVKSYKCARCPAAYSTSSNLRAHVRARHERARPHTCPLCGNVYRDRATLTRHIDAHSDIKRHVCEVCNTGFTKRSYWKKHLKRQHDISIPNVRPGPPKTNAVILDPKTRDQLSGG